MNSQHWPADPIRPSPPPGGPDSDVRPEAPQQKAEQGALDSVLREFSNPNGDQAVAGLQAHVDALEAKFSRMQGRGGIRVTNGEIIELSGGAARLSAGSGGASMIFRVSIGGVATDVRITEAEIVS